MTIATKWQALASIWRYHPFILATCAIPFALLLWFVVRRRRSTIRLVRRWEMLKELNALEGPISRTHREIAMTEGKIGRLESDIARGLRKLAELEQLTVPSDAEAGPRESDLREPERWGQPVESEESNRRQRLKRSVTQRLELDRENLASLHGDLERDRAKLEDQIARRQRIEGELEPKKPLSRSDTQPSYPDLPTELTSHTWLLLLYTVGCVLLVHLVGRSLDVSLLFLIFQVPTLLLASSVLRKNARLAWRIPWIWFITALAVWGFKSLETQPNRSPGEIASIALGALVFYWLVRALLGSLREFRSDTNEQPIELIAGLISAWGATLQIALLATILFKQSVLLALRTTQVGSLLVNYISAIAFTSPLVWLPSGILALGLGLFAALRFRDDPYRAIDFNSIISPIGMAPFVAIPLFTIRLPIWILIIVLGFIAHFIKQFVLSFAEFFMRWLSRLILIILGLLLPTAAICAAHYAVFVADCLIRDYVLFTDHAMWGGLIAFLKIHGLILAALCLYCISVLFAAVEIEPVSIELVARKAKMYLINAGLPAMEAVGKSFALYGVLVLAIPVGLLIPGGTSFGLFSLFTADLSLLSFALRCCAGTMCIFRRITNTRARAESLRAELNREMTAAHRAYRTGGFDFDALLGGHERITTDACRPRRPYRIRQSDLARFHPG